MTTTAVQTANAPTAVGPYSQAVEANGLLFVSGQLPLNPDTGVVVNGGIEEQTRQVLSNLSAILAEAGLSTEAVVKTTVLLTDIGHFPLVNELYGQTFTGPVLPARAAFQVAALPKEASVEIELIAAR